jgi:hypothetical protein
MFHFAHRKYMEVRKHFNPDLINDVASAKRWALYYIPQFVCYSNFYPPLLVLLIKFQREMVRWANRVKANLALDAKVAEFHDSVLNTIIPWATVDWEKEFPHLMSDRCLLAAIRGLGPGETLRQAHPDIFARPTLGLTSAPPASARSGSIPPPEAQNAACLMGAGGGEREESPAVIDYTDLPVSPRSGTRGMPLARLTDNWMKLCSALKKPEEVHAQRKLQTALAARDEAAEKLESVNVELARANAELARAQKFIDDSDKEIRKCRLRHIRGMERVISLRLKNNKGRRKKKDNRKGKGKGKGKGREKERKV